MREKRKSAFRRLELVGPRSKSGDLTSGYTSRGRDSSYFCLLIAFRLLFLADVGIMLCHVNGMGRVCSKFKGLLPE